MPERLQHKLFKVLQAMEIETLSDIHQLCWHEINSLRLERSMINPHLMSRAHQVLVGNVSPLLAPLDELGLRIPIAALRAKAFRCDLSRGQQQMRMRIVWVIHVEREIHHHAFVDEGALREVSDRTVSFRPYLAGGFGPL